MKEEAFLNLLSHFAERPVPAITGRHVYLWHGNVDRLFSFLPGAVKRTLDLHSLAASLSQAPRSIDGARSLIQQAIASELASLGSREDQKVLVVTGCDLLSRYRVSLRPFFEVASEHTAVVLAVLPAETRFRSSEPLPDYVSLNPHAPFDYLCAAVGQEAVVDTVVEELP